MKVADSRDRPLFTTALIAGDCVIMDVICKLGLQARPDPQMTTAFLV